MNYIINTFSLLFLTTILGNMLGNIKIKGAPLGKAMVLIVGLFISLFAGVYINTIPAGHSEYINYNELLSGSIVSGNILNIFLMLFISGVGLMAGTELLSVLKKYGVKFLILSIIITSIGAVGTLVIGSFDDNYTPYELSGVFSGALSSTPGMTAGLASAEDRSMNEIENFDNLKQNKKDRIEKIIGKAEDNKFSESQKEEYKKYASTGTGIGYTLTFPFGNILVLIMINIIPLIFKIDIEKEKRLYEKEMQSIIGLNKNESSKNNKFDITSFFFVLLSGYLLGMVKIGSFSLSTTGGVLISSLVLGSMKKLGKLDFVFNENILATIRDIGMVGSLSAIGLRLGYPVLTGIKGGQSILILYAIIIGFIAMLAGFVIGKYVFKMNWMLLSGAICGGMTNTSGLGVAVDATNSDYPSIGYASTYPFALIMMVIYTVMIQGIPI